MISPAPHHYPSGPRPVAATGAGVQFATGPNRGASWDEGYTGLGSGLTQNGTGTAHMAGRWHSIFKPMQGRSRHGLARCGVATRNPTERGQFLSAGQHMSRMGPAVLRWARQQRNPRRYSGAISHGTNRRTMSVLGVSCHDPATTRAWRGIQAQFHVARQAGARSGQARLHVTGGDNPGHFPKHQEAPALRGATVDGITGSV